MIGEALFNLGPEGYVPVEDSQRSDHRRCHGGIVFERGFIYRGNDKMQRSGINDP